jgi:hypothetical protein
LELRERKYKDDAQYHTKRSFRMMRQAIHTEEMRNTYKMLVSKAEGYRPLRETYAQMG